ncbi:MAG: type II secretion system protein [Candidatus Gastranaerophilales bacterium]|nr:type II secretion system protein [Candidatus Gastranaerophilales bacterium]
MKKAFTLAEVLITLVIIGVIAAMTIPALLNSTNNEEKKTALKKSISIMAQAVQQEYALSGKSIEDFSSVNDLVNNFFKERCNVIAMGTGASSSNLFSAPAFAELVVDDYYYTADGIGYSFRAGNIGDCPYSGSINDDPCFIVTVDVNGEKGPNQTTNNVDSPKDRFEYLLLYRDAVVPAMELAEFLGYKQATGGAT